MKRLLAQILVVVANIQMRTLKIEVETWDRLWPLPCPLTGTRACASLALPAHGRRRRCSAGGGGAGASPGVFWGTARPRAARHARPGRLRGAPHPLRNGEGGPTAILSSSSGLVFVLPWDRARAWEARRLVLSVGALAAPIASPPPALPHRFSAGSVLSLGPAAPPPVARPPRRWPY